MEKEEHFFAELENIPEVPDDIFSGIERRIEKRHSAIRSVWLAAACLVLIASGIVYFQYNKNQTQTVALDAAEELQYIEDYFSYNDLAQDTTLYSSNGLETEEGLSSIISYFSGETIKTDVDMYAILDNEFL